MAEELDVIAVGAHPDDVEVGCGGTLALLRNQGYKVGIVDLTDGEPTPNCPSPDVRIAEANEAAKVLGCERIILGLENRRLFDSFEARVELGKVFRQYRPKLVLGLLGKTPMASPDHWQASQITDAAVFYSRLSKWDQYFDGLPTHVIGKLAYYSLLNSEFNKPAANEVVVDISSTLEAKLESIRCYKTQFPPEKQHVFEKAEAISRAVGASAGFSAGEAIVSSRAIGTTDLMNTLFNGLV
ncbi:MAG: PIG-L family deacetylase [Planctomycetota bacterium]